MCTHHFWVLHMESDLCTVFFFVFTYIFETFFKLFFYAHEKEEAALCEDIGQVSCTHFVASRTLLYHFDPFVIVSCNHKVYFVAQTL